jgi:outer membrane protein TolC
MTFRRHAAIALSLALASPLPAAPLQLEEVLTTVRTQYPPLLAAWLRQDIANGRIRQAQGAFDPILSSSIGFRPLNYYDGSNTEIMLEQPLSGWGGSVYSGYRLSSGFLADYDRKIRTADGGEAVLGMKVPLLRDGDFDSRRAKLGKAAVDRELADPFILRQYLDFHRAARISYFKWLAAGQRLTVAEKVLRIARDRDESFTQLAAEGAIAPIVQRDNQALVVTREISAIDARRSFEAASIELSLFHRNPKTGDPIVAERARLPETFPTPASIDKLEIATDRGRAAFRRPEMREIDLLITKAGIDRRLARNQFKPNLDLALELNQELGKGRPSDIDQTELAGFLKFSVPIGRDEARGRIQAIEAEISKLDQEKQYVRERIIADANDAYSAVTAAYNALDRTHLNVSLAEELEAAENEKFRQGASDLLALQIREQATFQARVVQIEAHLDYFKALADYQAAVAADAPSHLLAHSK